MLDGSNLGGRFALPPEFDSSRYASAFVAEGNEVLAKQREEVLQGTCYTAPGWKVWKYPKTVKGETTEHPSAGERHIVVDAGGKTKFVLMYRPLDVQKQVNEVYGALSTDRMINEIKGETVSSNQQDDPGILSNQRLNRVHGKEPEIEEYVAPDVVGATLNPSETQIKSKSRKISQ